ncbi:MAG: M55 family metallopeptidase [Candidatus Eisenbacteria bacterium]|uniref:M55 family metallopeptidase n=1 Tax=Eiseniibacteriota bacterium TaxID=2212470 RepID=A0A948RWY7_UNCEI|nr:M55 family metallopeptidase [Candidatus Eisenbacteria bacterium]MBU1947100.1 M55 family metallopeptidase [Candidatus Eisenbacteria bacterium]MBU2691486.1 M55 family metallopeptidase [Candidatus Eisenbacteria bacterium]
MKIYISADIEGIAGVSHWDEAEKKHPDCNDSRTQMTAEVIAACEGIYQAGDAEIWIKDAHDTGRNIHAAKLPESVKLIRGWSAHPFMMLQELDDSFDAVMMIGYHSRAGADTNPLSHTLTGAVNYIKINDLFVSEFLVHAYAAALVDVPVVFLSGDEGLCQEVIGINPHIKTNAVMRGIGDSAISIHPALAVKLTRERVKQALESDISKCKIPLPYHFSVKISYKKHMKAYRASFYPGAKLIDPQCVSYAADDYFEVLRFFYFTVL